MVVAACSVSPSTSTPVSLTPTPTSEPTSLPTPAPLSPPYWPTQDWRASTPEQQGMDSAQLGEMLAYIQERGYPFHGVVIVRNGYLVLEAYVHPFRAGDRHHIASCTKSFTSALIGIAIEQDYIDSVDHKLLDFFPGRTVANVDTRKQAITLEHLLTMSSGFSWLTRGPREFSLSQLMESQDWVQFVLDRPMKQEPGTVFNYDSGGSHLLSAIIWQTTNRQPLDFAQENLFTPLGISDVLWPSDPTGINFGGAWLELTPRDMAKFGYLYLQHGVWDGQSVVPAEWVETSTTSHIETDYMDYHYGYQWWVDPAGGYHARGHGGQYIFVVPEQNMVVVFVGGFSDSNMETVPDALLKTFIIPAAKSTGSLPANPEQAALLESRLHTLANPEPKPVPPLPAIAQNISGKTYMMQANSLGLEAFTLSFSEKPESQALLNVSYESGPIEVVIGLDDVYRFTSITEAAEYSPGFIALKGSWVNSNTFNLYYMHQGYTGYYWFVFEEKGVKARFEEPWGAETVSGTLQE
jgi:CubicO group peptidase (beta-lactamase class C family)